LALLALIDFKNSDDSLASLMMSFSGQRLRALRPVE
jgi:hypothetical protein